MILALLACSLLAVGCGGSESTEGGGDTNAIEATEAAATPPRQQPKSGPTEAILEPVGDDGPTGVARYLLKPNRTPVFKLEMHGLEPTSAKGGYRLWVFGNRHDMVGLATFKVGKTGRISYKSETVESHIFVEEGSKPDLLITRIDSVEHLREALLQGDDLWDPLYIGEPILRGTFEGPFVGSADAG
jgi:hypothetical protein